MYRVNFISILIVANVILHWTVLSYLSTEAVDGVVNNVVKSVTYPGSIEKPYGLFKK